MENTNTDILFNLDLTEANAVSEKGREFFQSVYGFATVGMTWINDAAGIAFLKKALKANLSCVSK